MGRDRAAMYLKDQEDDEICAEGQRISADEEGKDKRKR
jgi:hypothetical protein